MVYDTSCIAMEISYIYWTFVSFRNEEEKEILINDPQKGRTKINVLGKSINTMKYW